MNLIETLGRHGSTTKCLDPSTNGNKTTDPLWLTRIPTVSDYVAVVARIVGTSASKRIYPLNEFTLHAWVRVQLHIHTIGQCKCYSVPVRPSDVRELEGVLQRRGTLTVGILVSQSGSVVSLPFVGRV